MNILISVIMEDACKEAEAILEKAEKEACSIREKALRQRNELQTKSDMRKDHLDVFFSKAKMISKAELKICMEIMQQKELMLAGVLDRIKEEFFSLSRKADYPAILIKLIAQGLQFLEGEEFTCRVNEQDQALLSRSIFDEINRNTGKKITLDEQFLEKTGGVFIRRRDGRVVYDNSLEAIFDRHGEELRSVAAEYLFKK